MRKIPRINVGIIAFLIIFIYLIIVSVIYLNKSQISIHEVTEKNISDGHTYKGIALRQEEIVNTEKTGYVNYYFGEGNHIAANEIVYTVDETGEIYKTLSEVAEDEKLSKDNIDKMRNDISTYKSMLSEGGYGSLGTLKSNLENTILEAANTSLSQQLKNILKKEKNKNILKVFKSKKCGIITYYIDGYEELKENQVKLKMFDLSNYKKEQLRKPEAFLANTPVYKMVTDENWSIILNLQKEDFEYLNKMEREQKVEENITAKVSIRFAKDGVNATVPFITYKKDDGYYAKLELDKYMVRYATERFLDIEITENNVEGLKLPKTAILKKEFYEIPIEYFTEGGNSGKRGLLKEVYKKNGDISFEFIEAEPSKEDKKFAYVDKKLFSNGDYIRNEKDQEKFRVSKTKKILGVYNANQGYCIFKYIEKIYENEEYCIIKKNTINGLSVYDHIIADAKTVEDQQIIN